jgi:hypothetical protein
MQPKAVTSCNYKDNMEHSGFTAAFKLSHSPITNYEFAVLKDEAATRRILDESRLYLICQRPALAFMNITLFEDTRILSFDIVQDHNGHRVSGTFPLYQELTTTDQSRTLEIVFGSNDPEAFEPDSDEPEVHGVKIYDGEEFLLWLSPDKFLNLHSNKQVEATLTGDYRLLSTFEILYVGKATDQKVWDRLSSHATLQQILSLVRPIGATIPTHEICLLLFEVASKWEINIYDPADLPANIGEELTSNALPSHDKVSLDAEKALVRLLDPTFNTVKFKKYPKSDDGLFQFGYDRFTFQFLEDIVFNTKGNSIYCSVNENECDFIGVIDNKELELISIH